MNFQYHESIQVCKSVDIDDMAKAVERERREANNAQGFGLSIELEV